MLVLASGITSCYDRMTKHGPALLAAAPVGLSQETPDLSLSLSLSPHDGRPQAAANEAVGKALCAKPAARQQRVIQRSYQSPRGSFAVI